MAQNLISPRLIESEDVVDDGYSYPVLLDYCGTMAMENCGGVEGLKECEEKPVNLEKLNIILKGTFAK
ncbi:MAG: plasmid pRiA4b ORF-3 family protein [Clostridia bacterium]|nr:plasmid pRiA4b ORF-3 family protein [Clostridia bacterium]